MKAFVRAIKQNNLDEVQRLLPTININDTYKGTVPLVIAKNKSEIFKLLLEQGANPNWIDHIQCSVLHHTVWSNTIETTRCLLKAGVQINAQDCHGNTALHYAIIKCSEEMVYLLLGYGADLNILNNKHQKPKVHAQAEIEQIRRTNFSSFIGIEQLNRNIKALDDHFIEMIKEPDTE